MDKLDLDGLVVFLSVAELSITLKHQLKAEALPSQMSAPPVAQCPLRFRYWPLSESGLQDSSQPEVDLAHLGAALLWVKSG